MRVQGLQSKNKYNSVSKNHSSAKSQRNVYVGLPLISRDVFGAQKVDESKKAQNKISTFLKVLGGALIIGGAALVLKKRKIPKDNPLAGLEDNRAQIELLKSKYNRIVEKFPNDIKYLNKLAESLGVAKGQEYKLAPVLGPDEYLDIVTKSPVDNFKIGANFEGVLNLKFKFNTHNHTTFSDGKLKPLEALEHARIYADKIAEKEGPSDIPYFTFGIADHDNIDAAKEILQAIVKDPYKYKNLKFIASGEHAGYYQNEQIFTKPIELEVLSVSADPFNKAFSDRLDSITQNRCVLAKELINHFSRDNSHAIKTPGSYSYEEAKLFQPNVRGLTNATMQITRDYLILKTLSNHYFGKFEKLYPDIEKFDLSKDFLNLSKIYFDAITKKEAYKFDMELFFKESGFPDYLSKKGLLREGLPESFFGEALPEKTQKTINDIKNISEEKLKRRRNIEYETQTILPIQEYFNLAKETGFTNKFILAHPGNIKIKAETLTDTFKEECRTLNVKPEEEAAKRLWQDLQTISEGMLVGGETRYQGYRVENKNLGRIWEKLLCNKKIPKTGSTDAHRNNLFTNRGDITEELLKKLGFSEDWFELFGLSKKAG